MFDSSYLNSFLEPHTISEAIVLPFGLHLFPYIVSKIDYFNKKLTDDLKQYSLKLPIIDCTLLREEFKIAFQKQKLNEEQIRQIQQNDYPHLT